MKNIQKKKGFTIVELVIVIAIIAVLSAVVVPTFSNLISKTKITSDKQLVQNLNTSLAVCESVNNVENKSLNEILNILETENGINIDNIKPSSDGSILYDSSTNRFLLTDKNENVIFYDSLASNNAPDLNNNSYMFWKIYDNKKVKLEDNTKYSIYWNSNDKFPFETVYTGLDLGDNKTITDINYVNNDSEEKFVKIRTNGGKLTINGFVDENGLGDVIYHYGKSNDIEIVAVGDSSYHEFGISLETTVHCGHFIAEAGSHTTILNLLNTVIILPELKSKSVVSFIDDETLMVTDITDIYDDIQDVLPKNEQNNCSHNFEIVDGFDKEICLDCGKLIDSNHEHIYDDYICDETNHKRTCKVCNKLVSDPHSLVVLPEEKPTCTKAGKTEGIYCSICNYVVKNQEIIEPSHRYEDEFTIDIESTCSSIGQKSRHCSLCDEKIEITYIAPKSHEYEDCDGRQICKNCFYEKHSNKEVHEWICTEENEETHTRFCFCKCGKFGEFGTVTGFEKLLTNLSDSSLLITLDKDYNFKNQTHDFNLLLNERITSKDLTIVIDGNGHTIFNLNSIQENAGLFGIVGVNLEIKNLKIEGGEVESSECGGIGAFIGYICEANIILDGCSVSKTKINRANRTDEKGSAGGLVGKVDGTLIVKNCSVENIELQGVNCGGIIGKCEDNSNVEISDCEINNININSPSEIAGGVIGYSKSKNVSVKSISGKDNKISATTKGLILGKGYCKISECSNFKSNLLKLKQIGNKNI